MQFKKLPPPYVSSFIPELNNMLKFLFNRKPVIDDKSITTAKLADNAVTNEKIANNAVTTEKIANYSIDSFKLNQNLWEQINERELPEVTAADNGKLLGVVPVEDDELSYDWGVVNKPDTLHNYSTSEQVVATWIDGKPLYEKTVDIANYQSATSGDRWVDFSTLGISNYDFITAEHIRFYRSDNEVYFGGYFVSPSTVRFSFVHDRILIYSTDNITSLIVTFQYTKSTDTAPDA